jgi:hypothetical protein
MNRRIRMALRLYPSWWRQRYAQELAALLEDCGSGWAAVADVLKGAMIMRVRDVGLVPLLAASLGAALGAVIVWESPALYTSRALVRMEPSEPASATPEPPREVLTRMNLLEMTRAGSHHTTVTVAGAGHLRISHAAEDADVARTIVDKIAEAMTTGPDGRGTVVEVATQPTAAAREFGVLPIPLGAGVGLVLGTAGTLVRRRRVG